MADSRLNVYYYPNVVFIDQDLTEHTISIKEYPEMGRNPQIVSFINSTAVVKKKDGSLLSLPASPYPMILFDYAEKSKWEKALKLCRFVKEPLLWSCLAAISLKLKQLDTAETAFAAIEQP